MNKISNKWKKISTILVGMVGIAVLNFNCSPSLFEAAGNSGSSSSSSSSSINYDKPNAPIALLTSEQTYQTMLNVTGQTAVPVATAEYATRAQTMSSTDSLANLTSPLMLASTSLGGDVCNSLITSEKAAATRKLMGGLDFNRGPASQASAYAAVTANMARSFYGRTMSADEQTIMANFFSEFTAGAADNADLTNDLMLGACAAMVSSFDALVY